MDYTYAPTNLNLGGISGLLNASQSNSAQGSSSSGWSRTITNAAAANANAADAASTAFQRQVALQQMAQDFNSEEAMKNRDWQTQMANTIYTRSIQNMKEAGINPILAASMGLSGASVGSGATASVGAGSAPLAQSFQGSETNSAEAGSSWGNSFMESGLPAFLHMMGDDIQSIINGSNAASNIEKAANAVKDAAKEGGAKTSGKGHRQRAMNSIASGIEAVVESIQ